MTQQPIRNRIILADALRGFALMGLFIVHMVEYFELYWYKPEPGWIHNLIFFLFGGKAYGIFALLFGLSFYIILDNYARRGVDFRARFTWRISLLLIMGYVHSLLYAGDILQLLAICGFLLVVCHTLSNFWIACICGFFLLQIPQIAIVAWHAVAASENYQQPLFWNLMGANFEVFANGSFLELIQHNLFDGQKGKWAFFIETGRLWNIFGLMFAGVLLGRMQFFESEQKTKHLFSWLAVSLMLFLCLKLIAPYIPSLLNTTMAKWAAGELFGYYINLSLISTTVLLFVLIFQTPIGRKILCQFAPIGRMTLTFYLAQSLIFVPLYYGFGLAWYASIGQLWSLLLGVAFWVLQMLIASYYLRHFRYGPLELAWRRATLVGHTGCK